MLELKVCILNYYWYIVEAVYAVKLYWFDLILIHAWNMDITDESRGGTI